MRLKRLRMLQGRSQDALVDRYGSRHTLGSVVSSRSVIDRMSEVLLYDCLQREAGHVLLRYVSHHGRQIDEQAVAQALRHVAPDLIFELQYEPGLLAMRDNLPGEKMEAGQAARLKCTQFVKSLDDERRYMTTTAL